MSEAGKFLKIFVICFVGIFIFINWGMAEDMFDYASVYDGVVKSVMKKDEPVLAEDSQEEEKSDDTNKEVVEAIERLDSIEISSIGVLAPLVFVENIELSSFGEGLDRGVAHYPKSALPGEDGQSIILGHSAPSNWPDMNYDRVFNDINDLTSGDKVDIFLNGKQYTYIVFNKKILNKGEDVPKLSEEGKELVLLTCWPPGKDSKRMAVWAKIP